MSKEDPKFKKILFQNWFCETEFRNEIDLCLCTMDKICTPGSRHWIHSNALNTKLVVWNSETIQFINV